MNTAAFPGRPPARVGSRAFAFVVGAVLLAAGVAAVFLVRSLSRKTVAPSFQRLTFRQGTVWTARFAPDGQTAVYSAAWEKDPVEVFLTRPGSPESRPLGLKNASLLAVSSTGELAVMLDARTSAGDDRLGTLARVPLTGGSPRPVMENVRYADWTSDGRELMVARTAGNKNLIEFPPGKVIYETTGRINTPRLSPRGDAVAFFESPVDAGFGQGMTSIRVVDLSGKARTLATLSDWWNLAWSADGKEIWYAAPEPDAPVTTESLQAVTLSGKHRLLMRYLGILEFHDVSRDGRVLLTRLRRRPEETALPPGKSKEVASTPLDASGPVDLSPADKARRALESFRSYERATGRKAISNKRSPTDPAGVDKIETVLVGPDTRSYVYYTHNLSDLYIVNGLK